MFAIILALAACADAAVARVPPTALAPAGAPSVAALAPAALVPSLPAPAPALLPAPIAPVPAAPSSPGRPAVTAAAVPAAAAPAGVFLAGWREAPIVSAADGTSLHFETRGPARAAAPVLFVGGLAMADSLRPLADARPDQAQAYLRLRGHAPSGWTRGTDVLTDDARDLARAVVGTAARFRSKGVTIVLHSYSGLAFQRMVQLESDPEVARALDLLARGRVDLITTTSRRAGDPSSWGPDYQAAAQALSAAAGWMDAIDAQNSALRDAARWNPLLLSLSTLGNVTWEKTREQAFVAAVQPLLSSMRPHLEHGWASARPGTREALRAIGANSATSPEWHEAILRRSLAVGQLDFAPADAARLRARGIRVLVIMADEDQLLTWPVRRILLDALKIASPTDAPPAGTELRDESGLFVAKVVPGDHYLPVKDPERLAAELSF